MCLDALLRDVASIFDENPSTLYSYQRHSQLTGAAYLGHLDCVKLLLAAGVDVNQNKYYGTAVENAAFEGHYNCVEFLVSAGANVNLKNKYGDTAVGSAFAGKCRKCVELLIDAGADVSDISIVYAARQGSVKCIKALIEAGADVNQKDHNMTAVLSASEEGYDECIELLASAGADVNIQDRSGETALILAVRCGHYKCVKRLILAGADINIVTKTGFTALHVVCVSFRNELERILIIELLLAAGAKLQMLSQNGKNALKTFLDHNENRCRQEKNKEDVINVITLLIKAGGDRSEVPDDIRNDINITTDISLMNNCCSAVRKHLIDVNERNLFVTVPELPLPTLVQKFLLNNISLEDSEECSGGLLG